MRPLELTVEGFRSYRERATFDFRGRRLVGVVGPIGSGKSSIIDAISFALFGKTPAVERDTKSLIHQLSDQCHVELVFEVDGHTWRARRAMRRGKGASGHSLELLSADAPDAEAVETFSLERGINERVEHLLGMDFHAFCRSVLLAQNRFSEFLKATAGDRDKVLKGVFGYEVLDAAQTVAKSRLDRVELELEMLGDERRRVDEARERLEEARALATTAHRRLLELEAASPEVDRLMKERAAASADAEAGADRIRALLDVTASLPDPADVESVATAASEADALVATARGALDTAEHALADRQAELGDLAARSGDRERFRSFDRLVQQQEQESKAIAVVRVELEDVASALETASTLVEARRAELAAAVTVLASAEGAEQEMIGDVERARATHAGAQHAEMAHELRGALVAGAACPVCDQPVHAVPKAGAAPKVAAAARALANAEGSLAKARTVKERSSVAHISAQAALDEASRRATETSEGRGSAVERLRIAEAGLAATNVQLAEWLGEGDARTLLEAREAEFDAAERATEEARTAVDANRAELERVREAAAASSQRLATIANRLSGAWGRLSEDRDVSSEPQAIRDAFVEIGEALLARHTDTEAQREAAAARAAEADSAFGALLASLDLEPGDDFRTELTEAGVRHGSATTDVEALEEQIGRSSELEGRVVAAEAGRGLAGRLAGDLKPSRFLAFLLEEERAELAELGSEHFEQLTDGGYRFADDGSFAIQDLNAAGAIRKADSLSGGETFLASLALALALAEMVARGGGRLDSFFLDEGFGSLDPEHLDRAMEGIARLVSENDRRLVVLVSHVAEMREAIEDLIVLDKHGVTGDTVVRSGASAFG